MINYYHPQVWADLDEMFERSIPFAALQNKTVLITGATGMLASYVAFALIHLNHRLNLNIRPVLLARSQDKLNSVYGEVLSDLHCLVQDVTEPIVYDGTIDFIFHAAGAASPHYILNDPVGIINANVIGTQRVLDCACMAGTQKVVFASTREVYGRVADKTLISEDDMGVLDPLHPRDCYPESKRLAEAMMMAYYQQYQVPFNTLRIAHTYGPGMQIENDGRVMADLINDAVNQRNIVLKSSGEAERAFCYITDAVDAILRVMLTGVHAQAYNVANESEPISILNLAKLLQQLANFGKGISKQQVNNNQAGYTNYPRTALSTERLQDLGWEPVVTLEDGLKRTLCSLGCVK